MTHISTVLIEDARALHHAAVSVAKAAQCSAARVRCEQSLAAVRDKLNKLTRDANRIAEDIRDLAAELDKAPAP